RMAGRLRLPRRHQSADLPAGRRGGSGGGFQHGGGPVLAHRACRSCPFPALHPGGAMNADNRTAISRRSGIAVLALLLAMPAAVPAAAPVDLAGDWQGKLTVSPGNSLTVRFTFTRGAN